jgi:hypothetical protein
VKDLDAQTCFCGEPLHYTNESVRKRVQALVDELGRFQRITVFDHGTYLVDRHYYALHGIKGSELPNLGFERIA